MADLHAFAWRGRSSKRAGVGWERALGDGQEELADAASSGAGWAEPPSSSPRARAQVVSSVVEGTRGLLEGWFELRGRGAGRAPGRVELRVQYRGYQ